MNRNKIGVTLLVCAILASGLVAAGIVASNGIATDSSDALSVGSVNSSQTLNVTVYADVQGQMVPIQGANVTVYEVTEVANDTVETITIEKIATSTTGVGGVAQIVLPEGNYTIVADYYGLRSVGILSSDVNGNITMVLNCERAGHGAPSVERSGLTADNNTTNLNQEGFGYGGFVGGATNQTMENMVAGMNQVVVSGNSTGSMGGPQRRH